MRLYLYRRWLEINQEWSLSPDNPKHCTEDPHSSTRCAAPCEIGQCPCEPDSEFHHNRPCAGPTALFAPAGTTVNGTKPSWLSSTSKPCIFDSSDSMIPCPNQITSTTPIKKPSPPIQTPALNFPPVASSIQLRTMVLLRSKALPTGS